MGGPAERARGGILPTPRRGGGQYARPPKPPRRTTLLVWCLPLVELVQVELSRLHALEECLPFPRRECESCAVYILRVSNADKARMQTDLHAAMSVRRERGLSELAFRRCQ